MTERDCAICGRYMSGETHFMPRYFNGMKVEVEVCNFCYRRCH